MTVSLELLVVIAIIAILAAILFPVFAKAREKARQITCASNLKQLGVAAMQYTEDYDECFPGGTSPGYGTSGHNDSGLLQGWAGQLYPYVKSTAVYQCPDDPTKAVGANEYPLSYLMNDNLMHEFVNNGNITAYAGIPTMVAPASTVMLFEVSGYQAPISTPGETESMSAVGWSYWSPSNIKGGTGLYQTGFMGGGNMQQNNGGITPPPDAGYALTGLHTDMSNVLCCDGHVKTVRGTTISPGLSAQNPTDNTIVTFACSVNELSSDPTGPYTLTMSKT
jgi:hypothetical protein